MNENTAKESLEQLNASVTTILKNLSGKELTVHTLAVALQELCPDIALEALTADCEEMLSGVRSGIKHVEQLLNMTDQELEGELPQYLGQMLQNLNGDQQHQYLILLYQVLRERAGYTVTKEEAIGISNTSNADLKRRVDDLLKLVQAEETNEIAQFLDESLKTVDEQHFARFGSLYTEEEKSWILAAAVYADSQKGQIEKIPAAFYGEVVSMSAGAAQSFHDSMLRRVIPTAVAALSVAAVCAVAVLCIKAVMSCGLTATVMQWARRMAGPSLFQQYKTIGFAVLLSAAAQAGKEIYDAVFEATATLTCRYIRDDARLQFSQAAEQYPALPEEIIVEPCPKRVHVPPSEEERTVSNEESNPFRHNLMESSFELSV